MIVRQPNLPAGPDALWDWMERRGLNQREASDIIGIDHTYLNHILCNRRKPGLRVALRIERNAGIAVEAWNATDVDKRELVGVGKARKR